MMIRVMYYDGLTEMVRPPVLQYLIEKGKIVRFRRREGWTEVGTDPVRVDQHIIYRGRDRRHRSMLT